jgi:hypothetical protein
MFDLHNNSVAKQVVIASTIGANATKTGVVVDRQGYNAVEFLVNYGAVTTTGTVVTVVALEGDVTGTMTSIADADLLGTEALAGLAAATPRTAGSTKEVAKRVGYRGLKRYVSMNTVSTGVTSVGGVSVTAILGDPNLGPTPASGS